MTERLTVAAKDYEEQTAGSGVRRLSQELVAVEGAMAFTLLTVASILVAHLQGLGRVDPQPVSTG